MVNRHYNLPSLSALAAFEVVARRLNVTRASEELNVTPGAVSKQIRAREAELGAPLMRRHHDGVSLTAEGAAVAASLSEAFSKVSATMQQVRDAGQRHHVAILSNMATMQFVRRRMIWNSLVDFVADGLGSSDSRYAAWR